MSYASARDIFPEDILKIIQQYVDGECIYIPDNGVLMTTEIGTPQGSIVSPTLANIYLHYSLDLWFEKVIKRNFRGQAEITRYADDFVCCFQYESEAKQFCRLLVSRVNKFNLEVERTKLKLILFGRFAEETRNKLHIGDIFKLTKQKLMGHYQYYRITDNSYMIGQFCLEIKKVLFKWLNGRSQRLSFDLEKFKMYMKYNPLPKPKINVNVYR